MRHVRVFAEMRPVSFALQLQSSSLLPALQQAHTRNTLSSLAYPAKLLCTSANWDATPKSPCYSTFLLSPIQRWQQNLQDEHDWQCCRRHVTIAMPCSCGPACPSSVASLALFGQDLPQVYTYSEALPPSLRVGIVLVPGFAGCNCSTCSNRIAHNQRGAKIGRTCAPRPFCRSCTFHSASATAIDHKLKTLAFASTSAYIVIVPNNYSLSPVPSPEKGFASPVGANESGNLPSNR